jgi:hypothetical protein
MKRKGGSPMQAHAFWKSVTMDHANMLEKLIALLNENGIRYCVIGGQAVNAYAEPLVSLDLDLVVSVDQLAKAESLFSSTFRVERFSHSLNVSAEGSDLRVQIQTDPRYFEFVERSSEREVLGVPMPVARLEDVLQGKVWAAVDTERRASKRRKDLLDIERVLEVRPDLRGKVPASLLDKLAD